MSISLKIDSISSTIFGQDLSTLYIPATTDQRYQTYKLSLIFLFGNNITIDTVLGTLVNSKTGSEHLISKLTYTNLETHVDIFVNLSSETAEDDDIDYISLKVTTTDGQEIFTRKKITVKKIKESFSTFKFKSGDILIVDSNLLSPRVKMPFAKWSTVHKNDISNASKLLEPLHSVFSSSFTKGNELLKQTYDLDYKPLTYSRIFLNGYPLNIFRNVGPYKEELKETDDIYSSIKKVEISSEVASLKLERFFLTEDTSNNKNTLKLISSHLPITLYLRKVKNNESLFCECVVKGFNVHEEPITERLTLRSDLYTQLQNKFARITSIKYSNNTVEVSTYVDLRYNHYIINRPYIIPPIVDSNFVTFKPHPVIKTNQEETHNTLVLNNGLNASGVEEYKFSFKDPVKIKSLYITEELDVIYVTDISENTVLNYSKLKIDYTKNIFNDKTLNNNKFISVSDTKTSIGDWVDVSVNLQDWFNYKGQKSVLLRVRNKDSVLYYSQEDGILTTDKSYLYSELNYTDILEFSIGVENGDPYIVSLIDEDGTEIVSAMTCIETIDPYYSEVIEDNYLIHYNNEIVQVENSTANTQIIETHQDSDTVTISLFWDGYSSLNFKINLQDGYFISNSESNLIPDYYEILLPETQNTDILVIKLNYSELKGLFKTDNINLSVGTAFNSLNGTLDGTETAKLSVKYINNTPTVTTVVPLIQYEDPYIMQKQITIEDNGLITIGDI